MTHVECVFRGFVGKGGNWRSDKKIEHTFIFNKISVQKRFKKEKMNKALFVRPVEKCDGQHY